jgi:hypothetical protein
MTSANAKSVGSAPVFVDVPTQEWLHNYLGTYSHPEVMKHDDASSGATLKLEMPYLELFSPTGVSLYRGGNDDDNAAFIRSCNMIFHHTA